MTTLKCRLKSLSLSPQKNITHLGAIIEELKGPGQHYGYRSVWQTLRQKHHLSVKRHDVMVMMAELDPSGVQNVQEKSLYEEFTIHLDQTTLGMLMDMTN